MDDVQVVAQMTGERDGYTALQLGAGTAKVKMYRRLFVVICKGKMLMPKAKLAEFRVSDDALVDSWSNIRHHLISLPVRKLMLLASLRVRVLLVR